MEEKIKKTCKRRRNKRLTLNFTCSERNMIEEVSELTGSTMTDMLVKAVEEYRKELKKEL